MDRTVGTDQQGRFTLLPQEHSVVFRQTSRWGQTLLLSLVGLGATAFATAWLYRIDEVITVQGRLVPEQGGVEVKSPQSGQLADVMVRSGDFVEKGEALLKYNVKADESEKTNLQKQLELEQKRLDEQLKSTNQRTITVGRNIELTKEILNRLIPLQLNGAISELQILSRKNELEKEKDQLLQLENQRNQIISDSNSRRQQIRGRLNQVEVRLKNEVVKSPISGTVFDLKPDNNEYVAQGAEVLLKIVPNGKLSAVVDVGNKDIGFIKAGAPVKVRVNSFPFTEYGEIPGIVERVGADALPPTQLFREYHFPVDITLERSTLKAKNGMDIDLQSGMTVTTNLKLRDRRLIEILSDIFSNQNESLKRLRQP